MTSLTFGQLVEQQQKLQDPSDDVVKAAEYVIDFGKHKGMNLSMLMEQQHSYCMWLLNQEESKNVKFNETVTNLKILIEQDEKDANPLMTMTVDGVELVEGEKAILHIDPANPEENGVYQIDPPKKTLEGLMMGKISDLLDQVANHDLTFDFSETDIDIWFKLVKEKEENNDCFIVIETVGAKHPHAQRIKKVITLTNLNKAKWVLPNA